MKQFLTFLIVIVFFYKVKAAGFDGYYVTNKNDTVYTKVYLPSLLGQMLFFDKIEVLDTALSKKVKLGPNDISCFVYFDDGKRFVYVSKSFENEVRFFERRIRNNNLTLYSYAYSTGTGQYSVTRFKFVIARNDTVYVIVSSADNAKVTREKLKAFFSESNTQQVIEEKFRYRDKLERDIIDFVNNLNTEHAK